MIVVGLTGSIATGKSTLAAMFRAYGAPVFDADAAVHSIYRGDIAHQIESAFPGVTMFGQIDRDRLSKYVVGNSNAMRQLEAIVHPAVAALRRKFCEGARQAGARIAILDVPLLFETGGERSVDVILTVSVKAEIQQTRALARPGASVERFEALLARQTPDREKRRRAHFVIDTSGSIADSRRQVEDFLRAISGAEGDTNA